MQSGVLNAVGLQNPGADAVIAEELPKLARVFHKPVMANVSGFSLEEYVEVCQKLDACPQVGWLEVNISCPNVHGGGMSFGTDPKAAAAVTRAVKAAVQNPSSSNSRPMSRALRILPVPARTRARTASASSTP